MAAHRTIPNRRTCRGEDPFALEVGEVGSEGPNVIAFLLGGIVITGGLLSFLLLDGNPADTRGLSQSDGFIRIEHSQAASQSPTRTVPSNQTVTN